MEARPCSAAQASSASALVPRMSELKPPSQNSPGPLPARARTAMRRRLLPSPTSIKVGSWSIGAGLVMYLSLSPPSLFVREPASSVKHGRTLLAHRAAELYLPEVTEMPRI